MTLEELQAKLKKRKIDAYIVTRNNMFLGQDVLEEENRLFGLTGFSGSAGTLIVLQDKAVLLVDGRYELQAPRQVDAAKVDVVCGFRVEQCLSDRLSRRKSARVAFNAWTCSYAQAEAWRRALPDFQFIADNSEIFDNNLNRKNCRVFEHKIEFSGTDRMEKLSWLAGKMKICGLDGWFITLADSVSWLLNIRSNCLPDTPLVRAYALVDKNLSVCLFGDNLDFDFRLPGNIRLLSTADIPQILKKFKNRGIGVSAEDAPCRLTDLMAAAKVRCRFEADPCLAEKAIKNPVEIGGIIKAHLRDGVALTKFLYWLDTKAAAKTELDIVQKLHDFRAAGQNFFSESFGTIAAFGSNGAIVHYQPDAETNAELRDGSLLLLDSGAQYFDGTTDVTRTVAVGIPSAEMTENFTLVLKSHIALASAVFPAGTSGAQLDAIARDPLWRNQKDFNHGTGHGVGCFLNVHEGPQSISRNHGYYPLQPGMVVSIEPGYYLAGQYGIRIENLALTESCPETENGEAFCRFKILTLAPVDKRLVNKYLMSSGEISWLNQYHETVFRQLSPFMDEDEKIWLKDACSPL